MSKTAIVTGATQGIGEAIAKKLASKGFNIALNCRNQERLGVTELVAEECRTYGIEAECFIADVAVYSQCEKMIQAVKERFGTIDVLVNNAGITINDSMTKMTEDSYDLVISTNQKSVFSMMKLVGGLMVRQRSGRIINIASVAGIYGSPGQIAYAASKAAVIGMTKTAAKEMASRGISVNAVAPGFIETSMTEKLSEEQRKMVIANIAMRRRGKAQDIANAVAFLASEEADYITGQVIEVSGGISM